MATERITIAGHEFEAAVRYAEGMTITAAEAHILNLALHKQLRNNWAKRLETVTVDENNIAQWQASFTEYANAFTFGIGARAKPETNPVMVRALAIARKRLGAALRKKGKALADFEPSAITERCKEMVDMDASILELAQAEHRAAVEAASNDINAITADLKEKS